MAVGYNPNVIVAGTSIGVFDPVRGKTWTIINGKVAFGGIVENFTNGAFEFALVNGVPYYRNASGWHFKPDSITNFTPYGPKGPVPTSENNTLIVRQGYPITDAAGNAWAIVGGKVIVNGVVDQTTKGVVGLAYVNGKVWQHNDQGLWWSKTKPTDAWGPPAGTKVSPIAASVDNTVLLNSDTMIVDSLGNVWELMNGKVAVNSVVDVTTKNVIELLYKDGKVWQQNSDHTWWSKSKPTDTWGPPAGTKVNPEGPMGKTWKGITTDWNDPNNWMTYGVPRAIDGVTLHAGSNITLKNAALPAGLKVYTVADGKDVNFTVLSSSLSHASFTNGFGYLNFKVNTGANFANVGTMTAQPSSGSTFINVSVMAGASFTNEGTMRSLPSSVRGPTGSISITGQGSFANYGLIDIQSSAFVLNVGGTVHSWGKFVSSGTGTMNVTLGQFGTATQFRNYGVVEADGQSSIQFKASVMGGPGNVYSSGSIIADGGKIDIDATLNLTWTSITKIQNNGSIQLNRGTDGGTIEIKSGMLAFGGFSSVAPELTASRAFHSDIKLSGASAKFDFTAGKAAVVHEFRALSPSSADLNVYTAGDHRQLASLHLVGNAYKAGEFQSVGGSVIYTDR